MSKVIEFKPKRNVVSQLTCPDCDGIKWRVLLSDVEIDGSNFCHSTVECESCEFTTPAIIIFPEGDDD